MSRHRLTPVATFLALGVLAARQPASAAGATLDTLPTKAPLASGDTLPVSPAGGPTLMKTTAGALRDFVLTSVKAFGAVGDGVADDTAALQAAIDSGLSLYCPPGTYKTTATLNATSPLNDGQTIRGSGSWGAPDSFNTTSIGTCVIKPTSAVTIALKIDGTPFSGGGYQLSWVQGFNLESVIFDMMNMTDDSSHIAINQVQAWGGHYLRVRVIHDGSSKRALKFSAGAFTTQVDTFAGHILEFTGDSSGFGVTTINVLNCDCGRVVSAYAGDLRFFGGAYQGADGSTKFYLRHSFDIDINADVEGTGVFLDLDSTDNFIRSRSELQGFSGTYVNGAAPDLELWDQQTNFYSNPACQWSSSYTGFSLNGCGHGSNYSTLVSGSTTNDQYMAQGRMSGETIWGVAGEANWFVGGSAQGDTVLGSITNSTVWLMANQIAAAKITPTGFYTFGTGTLNQGTINATTAVNSPLATITYAVLGGAQLKPATDGQMFTLQNAVGGSFMLCNSSATIGNSFCSVGAGADWRGFSDTGFSVQTYDLDASTGNATFSGTITGLKFAGALNGSVGATTPSSVAATTITASSSIAATGVITASKGVVSTASTVSGLPASPTAGQSGFVTDATACTFASTVTGGGSTKCPVVYTGSAWIAG